MTKPFVTDEDRQLIRTRSRELRREDNSAARRWNAESWSIRHGQHLRPWMLNYAEWLVMCPERPTRTACATQSCLLSRAKIGYAMVRNLEMRPDFIAYCEELQRGPFERARAKYLSRLPEYIDAHKDALDKAQAAGDYRTVAQIAESAIDRVAPKRQEAVAATQVTVVLSPHQLAGFQQYTPAPVEAEIVPDERQS